MKRAFRVATVFTGAAACAGVLTPAAQAAVVAPGGAVRATPDAVAVGSCSPNINGDYNTLALYYLSDEHHPPACFTGSGYWYVGTGVRFAKYCAEGKSGYLEIKGTWERFTPGDHNLHSQYVSAVSMGPGGAAAPCGA